MGKKGQLQAISEYFFSFRSAAEAAQADVMLRLERATVSVTETSQVAYSDHRAVIIIIIIIMNMNKITKFEKKSWFKWHSPCNKLKFGGHSVRFPKCFHHAECVPTLNCDRETLTEKRCRIIIINIIIIKCIG